MANKSVSHETKVYDGGDPRSYFNLEACRSCDMAPCSRLRFGGVYAGKLIFVPAKSAGGDGCPFAPRSFFNIEMELEEMALQRLDSISGMLLESMALGDRQRFDISEMISDYSDRRARIQYIKILWENHVAEAIQIPHNYRRNDKLISFLHRKG